MKSLIRQLSPSANVSPRHPLFRLESRRARRLLDSNQLFQMSFNIITTVFLILFFFWLLASIEDSKHLSQLRSGATNLLTLIFAVSIGLDGILDFACMVASVNSFSGEFIAARWDLVRLTPVVAEDMIAVKHAAARLRVWRLTIAIFAVRLSFVLFGFATWLLNDGLYGFQVQLEQILGYLVILVAVVTYLVEPFWRAEVVTAIGLAISSRFRSGLSLILGAVGSVLTFWIVQPLVLGAIFWCSGAALGRFVFSINSSALAYFVGFLISLYMVAVLYGFYAIIKKVALENLLNRIIYIEG